VSTPETPAEWLPILTKQIDNGRPRITALRRYVDGDAPMPEMSRNTRAAWQQFQRKSRTNWGELIVEAVADRIIPIGIEVAGSTESDEAKAAQRIWRDNRMDVAFKKLIRDGLAYRDSYLIVGIDDDAQAVITAESPAYVTAATDPIRPWVVRAAIKVWRDPVAKTDYAYVWIRGGRQRFERPATRLGKLIARAESASWVVSGEFEQISGDIPIYPYENPSGYGEFERHTDLIDRINHGLLQRLVITAMQAFRQRALRRKRPADGVPFDDDDSEGNDPDWSVVFEHAPGALWDLPEDMDIWESAITDVTQHLSAHKSDLRDLAAVTRTSLPMLIPDGANQSAAGAGELGAGMYLKAADRLQAVQIALAAALVKAMRVEGIEPSGTVRVLFEAPERVSLTEKYAAAGQARAAGESWESIQRNILGRTPDQIARDAEARAREATPAAAEAPPGGLNLPQEGT